MALDDSALDARNQEALASLDRREPDEYEPPHEHEYGEWEYGGPLYRNTERRWCECGAMQSRARSV